jgi:hypothetical protein
VVFVVRRARLARFVTAVLAAAAMSTAGPVSPARAASAYQQVLHAYEHSGAIPPCRFSGATLAAALKGVDSYGAQYFADFTQAVNDALSARAAGTCSSSVGLGRGAGTSAGGPAPGVPGMGLPAHLPALTAATGGSFPAALLLLGALTVSGAFATGVALVLRARGR